MHRIVGALLVFSFTLVAARGMAVAMTMDELAEALRRARLPQADVVAELPGEVDEQSFDFLKGGTYLKVTLHGPWRTQILRFVRQGSLLIPIQHGREGRQRITSDLDISVRSADAALRYVQWLLDVTREGGLWLVESVDDVPFMRATHKEKDLQAQIHAVRQDLESKIEPSGAEESGPVFVVHQDAVAAHDLVRYTVKVSRLGLASIEITTIARDLPVVYVEGS
jgi:hypothetical protein